MPPDDPGAASYQADPRGIMHCLRMLAEEAATLRLARTFEAIRQALEVCASENRLAPALDCSLPDGSEPPASPATRH